MALLDYLAERRLEIEAQIKTLKGELAEIRIAEAALTGVPTGRSVVSSHSGVSSVVREGSIKDWVLRALAQAPFGLETERVIEAVHRAGGPEVPRSSMTPQLSRLKAAGLITQYGRVWAIPSVSELQTVETPGVQSPGVSDAGDHDDLR
ncbi:MAG: hypothetical protein ACJ798_13515 [Phenylobacterium sp.]